MKSKLIGIKFRFHNAVLDLWDRWVKGRCCAKPKYGQGGYHFWRCSLPHGHDGPHRTCNYLWGIGPDGKSQYDPDNGVPELLERKPVRTRRQRREFDAWHEQREAERRALAELHCCYIPPDEQHLDSPTGCPNQADYVILDLAEQNPYLAETHACADHVGPMLGHADGGTWRDGDPERWEVRSLAS